MDGRTRNYWVWGVAVGSALLLPALVAAGATRATLYTGPSDAAATEIALSHVRAAAGDLGLEAADVADVAVSDLVPTAHNGVTHVYLRQRVNGLEIDGAEMGIHVDRRGRIFHRTGGFVANAAERAGATPGFPRLSADEAVRAAAERLGNKAASEADLALVEQLDRSDRRTVYRSAELSEEEIPVRLRYYRTPDSDRLTLAWNLNLKAPGDSNWWDVWVDASTGELVGRVNWTSDATYRVYALPRESPDDGPRTDEVDPHVDGGTDPATGASPYGWHDLDGVNGAETTLTSGNNVNACTDVDANNACDAGSQPDGGASLIFQPPIDLGTQEPDQYRDAAVVNLYYWNNIIHDVSYQYGFDEASGNFQENNYGRGGNASDSVNADAQDGSGFNNANFSTPGDGVNPRMQMFVWLYPITHEVFINGTNYDAFPTNGIAGGWGADPPDETGVTGPTHLADDGTGASTTDACEPLIGPYTNEIVIIDRGNCEFGVKGLNAQNAGAIGAIIVTDDRPPTIMAPGAVGNQVTIALLMVNAADGATIKTLEPMPATLRAKDPASNPPNRDSDLDNGVIVHEYGHGISNRLTGGPATTSCLNNNEQMGEGWSDWQTLFLNSDPSDTATTPRPVATYLTFEDSATGRGIRNFPYTTDNGVSPLTYADIGGLSIPHGVGEVWALAVWEMYWNLVGEFGYDADLYNGTGGNNLAYQLVMDGMKLQPCRPGFVDGRDGILAADEANYDGDLACHIWNGFADRGVGLNASQGSNFVVGDEVEDFTVPDLCIDAIFHDSFGFGTDRWSSVVQ